MSILMVYFIFLNSKEKEDYQRTFGRITYFDKKFGEYPNRDFGKYRYIKFQGYPYIFEIYSDDQSAIIDNLKVGDEVIAYYYETNNTHKEQINRFLQYLEKNNVLFFRRKNTNIIIGFTVIGLSILIIIGSYMLYKKNKIAY